MGDIKTVSIFYYTYLHLSIIVTGVPNRINCSAVNKTTP